MDVLVVNNLLAFRKRRLNDYGKLLSFRPRWRKAAKHTTDRDSGFGK